MNKKLIIFAVSSFVAGAAIGGTIGFFIGKKKSVKEDYVNTSDEEVAKTKEEKFDEIQSYKDLADELEYRSNDYEEEFTEEDQEELESLRLAEELTKYKDERSSLIEEITMDMYYGDCDETGDLILGYEQTELYYFVTQEVLVTDLGELKLPIEHFVGDILERSDKDVYYIRNHIEEENYKVMKRDPKEMVEDYFPDAEV